MPGQGGFPGPVRSYHGQEFAFSDVQVQPRQGQVFTRFTPAINVSEAFNLNKDLIESWVVGRGYTGIPLGSFGPLRLSL